MSNFLAVATVTETLRQMLEVALSRDISGGARATAVRPAGADKSSMNGLPELGVNVYLYRIGFNAERRNSDLPNRRPDGSLMQRPKAALDLNYLLSFYGDEKQLEPQRVLGSVISALHSRPMLTHLQIKSAVQAVEILNGSDLTEEPELVKFTPLALTVEEMHNLWSGFFQSPYVLSTAIQASVVFIEGRETAQESLPVQKFSINAAVLRQPFVERIFQQDNMPIMQDSCLTIAGRNLSGTSTRVRVGKIEIVPMELDDNLIKICLSQPPFPVGSLLAGINSLQVIHEILMGEPPVPHMGFESNAAAFVLRPTIISARVSKSREMAGSLSGELTLQVRPLMGKRQRAILLLNEIGEGTGEGPGAAYVLNAPGRSTDADEIIFAFEGVRPGSYALRIQVDGAQSPLFLDEDPASSTRGLYVKPKVVIAGPA
jgi:hypothetical protein